MRPVRLRSQRRESHRRSVSIQPGGITYVDYRRADPIERIVQLAHDLLRRATTAGYAIRDWRTSRGTARYLTKLSPFVPSKAEITDLPTIHCLLGYQVLPDEVVPPDQIWLYDRRGENIGAISVIE
jgi:hypothetical protein